MKLPFYYTFAELKQYYELELHTYLMCFPDATEQDFAYDYKKLYNKFFSHNQWNFKIPVKRIYAGTNEVTETALYYMDWIEMIENRVRKLIIDTDDESNVPALGDIPIFDIEFYDDEDGEYSEYHSSDGYILDRETFNIYKELISFDISRFPQKYFMEITPERYKNFRFSMVKIYNFLDDIWNGATGISENGARINEVFTSRDQQPQQYSDNVSKLVNVLFGGDFEKLEFLRYLSHNFTSTSQRFTDLTKYNQIYAFLLSSFGALEQRAYKDLILELFGFDYGNRLIKGDTPVHKDRLEKIASYYTESNK